MTVWPPRTTPASLNLRMTPQSLAWLLVGMKLQTENRWRTCDLVSWQQPPSQYRQDQTDDHRPKNKEKGAINPCMLMRLRWRGWKPSSFLAPTSARTSLGLTTPNKSSRSPNRDYIFWEDWENLACQPKPSAASTDALLRVSLPPLSRSGTETAQHKTGRHSSGWSTHAHIHNTEHFIAAFNRLLIVVVVATVSSVPIYF